MYKKEKTRVNVIEVYEGCGINLSPCFKECGHQKLSCPWKCKVQLSHDKRGLKREIIDGKQDRF